MRNRICMWEFVRSKIFPFNKFPVSTALIDGVWYIRSCLWGVLLIVMSLILYVRSCNLYCILAYKLVSPNPVSQKNICLIVMYYSVCLLSIIPRPSPIILPCQQQHMYRTEILHMQIDWWGWINSCVALLSSYKQCRHTFIYIVCLCSQMWIGVM